MASLFPKACWRKIFNPKSQLSALSRASGLAILKQVGILFNSGSLAGQRHLGTEANLEDVILKGGCPYNPDT